MEMVDGDSAFLIGEDNAWLLDLAQEQMKDIRPLCYPMGKAGKLEINSQNIYESLKYAWHNGNIGKISNASTNIWSKDQVTEEDIKMTNLLSVAKLYLFPISFKLLYHEFSSFPNPKLFE